LYDSELVSMEVQVAVTGHNVKARAGRKLTGDWVVLAGQEASATRAVRLQANVSLIAEGEQHVLRFSHGQIVNELDDVQAGQPAPCGGMVRVGQLSRREVAASDNAHLPGPDGPVHRSGNIREAFDAVGMIGTSVEEPNPS
jgi:hypothetical protein